MRQLQVRHAAYTLQAGSEAKVVRCCRRDPPLSASASASAQLDLASLGLCQNIFVAALNEFNDAASARNMVDVRVGVVFVAVSGHKIDCLSRLMRCLTSPRVCLSARPSVYLSASVAACHMLLHVCACMSPFLAAGLAQIAA